MFIACVKAHTSMCEHGGGWIVMGSRCWKRESDGASHTVKSSPPPAHLSTCRVADICLSAFSPIRSGSPRLVLLTVVFERCSRVMFLQHFRHRLCVAQSFNQAFCCINTQTASTLHALEAKYPHSTS